MSHLDADGIADDALRSLPVPAGTDWSLWCVDLDAFDGGDDACTAGERAAARRFRFPHLQRRALASRHALRVVLGRTLDCAARDVAFSVGPLGKPALAPTMPPWHFNLSHSEGLGLIGVRRAGPIGVDIEVARPGASDPLLVERLFTAAEQREWQRAPADERDRCFLSAWTRKEACVKALGTGLSLEANLVDAGCAAAPRRVQITIAGWRGELTVCSVDPGVPALAAVATTDEAFARHACERLA